jgi:hypothetical protein
MASSISKASSSYSRTFTEKEPTCPGGGRMTWRVAVDEPRTSPYVALYAFISIEESSSDHSEKDALLLDLDAARWLYKTLGEAIEIGEDAEKRAALLDKAEKEITEGKAS